MYIYTLGYMKHRTVAVVLAVQNLHDERFKQTFLIVSILKELTSEMINLSIFCTAKNYALQLQMSYTTGKDFISLF